MKFFVLSSKRLRQEANKIIRKYNLIPYCCEGCENKGTWNGKPITLQLEHKMEIVQIIELKT